MILPVSLVVVRSKLIAGLLAVTVLPLSVPLLAAAMLVSLAAPAALVCESLVMLPVSL